MSNDNDEELWGNASTSAFPEPPLVVDTSDENPHPDAGDSVIEDADEAAPAKPPKPNIAILALAGLLVVGVLGGAGMMVKSRFLDHKASEDSIASSQGLEEPIATDAPSVFDAPSKVAEVPAATVFDQAAAPVAQPASETVGTPASPTSSPVAAAAAPPAVAAVSEPKPSAKNIVAETSAASKTADVTPVKTEKLDQPATVVKTQVRTPHHVAVHHAVNRAPQRVASNKPRKDRKDTKSSVEVAAAPAQTEVELPLLPKGLKVRSVYPQWGKDVQAWISDASGRTEIIRVGDTLRNGAYVKSIVAEKGEVITSAGVITTNGVK